MNNAEQFYRKWCGDHDLVYPPQYVKGKNGKYVESVCFLPGINDGYYEDYSYYSGVYLNLNFADGWIYVFVDGTEMQCFYSVEQLNLWFDETDKTAFQQWLADALDYGRSMLADFLEQ